MPNVKYIIYVIIPNVRYITYIVYYILYIYIPSSLFIHLRGHLSCFYILVTVTLQWTWECGYLFRTRILIVWFNIQEWNCHIQQQILFNFLRNPWTAFPIGGSGLHRQHQCTKVVFSPHPCRHWLCPTHLILWANTALVPTALGFYFLFAFTFLPFFSSFW